MTVDMTGWRRMFRRRVESISWEQRKTRLEAGLFVSG